MSASVRLYVALTRTLSEFQNEMPATTFVRLVTKVGETLQEDNVRFDIDKFRKAACKVYDRF
jgi:hypothetical protein